MSARGNSYLPWIQPILVAKEGSHTETILCGALASLGVWLRTPQFAPAACAEPASKWSASPFPDSNFDRWLAGPFGKTVRRCSAAEMDKVAAWCAEQGITFESHSIGASAALALPPMRYEEMPKRIAKAQVSGTDLERAHGDADGTADDPEHGAAPYVTLHVDEGLSTGKATAQAAHALWMYALARLGTLDADVVFAGEAPAKPSREELAARIDAYRSSGPAVRLQIVDAATLAALDGAPHTASVRDAGLTEIEAGTLTAVADWRPAT